MSDPYVLLALFSGRAVQETLEKLTRRFPTAEAAMAEMQNIQHELTMFHRHVEVIQVHNQQEIHRLLNTIVAYETFIAMAQSGARYVIGTSVQYVVDALVDQM